MKMKSFSILSIAALVALLGALVVAPSAASAQMEDDNGTDLSNVFDLEVSGATDDGGTFEGTFSVDEFSAGRDGELFAVGTLTGELTYSGENGATDESSRLVEEITEESVMIPVTTEGFGKEGVCGDLSLMVGPADVDLGDVEDGDSENGDGEDGEPEFQQVATVLHLDTVSFDVSTDAAFGDAFGAVLCNLSGLFGDELDASTLANLLNLILQIS